MCCVRLTRGRPESVLDRREASGKGFQQRTQVRPSLSCVCPVHTFVCVVSLTSPGALVLFSNDDRVNVTFLNKDGTKQTVTGHVGQHILDVAHKHGIDLEGGALCILRRVMADTRSAACEASLACSTCHVILTPDYYKKVPCRAL